MKSIEGLFPKNMRNDEIKNGIDETRKWEEKIKRKDLKCKTNKYLYDFQKFEAIISFGDSIYTGKIDMNEPEMDQTNLLENMKKINNKSKSKTKEGKHKKQNTLDSVNALYEGLELTLSAFRSEIFPIEATKGKPCTSTCDVIVLAQVKAGNTFENLPSEIRQITYCSYLAKEFTKKVHNKITKSKKL